MYNEKNMQYNGLSDRSPLSSRSEQNGARGGMQSDPQNSYQGNPLRGYSMQNGYQQSRSSRSRMSQERSESRGCHACSSSRGNSRDDDRSIDRETRNDNRNCDCETHWGLTEHPLAMMYSPYQSWRGIYKSDTSLERGTMFSELDLPFEGSDCRR